MGNTLVAADPRKEVSTTARVAGTACAALIFGGFERTTYGTVLNRISGNDGRPAN